MNYVHKHDTAYMDADVKRALTAYVGAVRGLSITRDEAGKQQLVAATKTLHAALYNYALLDFPTSVGERCSHPNAYHLHGAHMYCPRCGEFNAMEE